MNWKTILVPHDFSSPANHAAAIARDVAKLTGGKLVLLHVIELPAQLSEATSVMAGATGVPISVREYATRGAQEHLDDIAARLAKDGARPTVTIRFGKPSEEILRYAAEIGAEPIAMGTHGRTGLAHLIAGSVTERVVRASHIPVLTVPHREHT